MAKLHHIRQLAVRLEGTPGTVEDGTGGTTAPAAADLIRIRELTLEQNPQYFERPLHSPSFGYVPRRQENTSCQLTFAVEVTGNTAQASGWGSSAAAPTWGRLLRACGLNQRPVWSLGVNGSITGVIQHLETLEDASGAAASAVGDYRGAQSPVYTLIADQAFNATDTVTGAVSGATFTVQAPLADPASSISGYAWYPNTDSVDTVTIDVYNDGDRIRVYGCRGDVTLDCQSQDIALLRFTIQGIYSATSATALLDDDATGVYPELIPPTFVDASLALWDGSTTITPNFTELQLTLGNNVVMRQNSNSLSGWLAAHIANRTPNGRFNPDDPGVSVYNYREKFKDNTRWALQCEWGSTAGNKFRVLSPAIELDSVGDGERDEVQSLDLSFRMTRGFEYGADQTNIGDDNEFIFLNI